GGRLGLVGAVQLDGGQVVVDRGDVEVEPLDRLEAQGALDVGGGRREPLQGAAEAVIVELLGGHPVGVGHGGGLGPRADAEEGLGLEQAVGGEDLDQGAEGGIALPGGEFVDGGGEGGLAGGVGDGGQGRGDLGVVAGGGG